MSFCGQMSPEQLELIVKIIKGKNVIIATDNDMAGDDFAEKIEKMAQRAALSVVCDVPHAKDWNDDLKEEITVRSSLGQYMCKRQLKYTF